MRPRRPHPAIASALVLLLVSIGWAASRDVAVFFLGGAGLALLAIVAVGLLVKAVVDGASRRVIGPALLLLAASPVALNVVSHSRDRLAFAFWALASPAALADGAAPDRIVRKWDGAGFAGMENDSYLIRDARDESSSLPGAQAWRKRLNLGCEIVATEKMRPNLYIVTTYNCTF